MKPDLVSFFVLLFDVPRRGKREKSQPESKHDQPTKFHPDRVWRWLSQIFSDFTLNQETSVWDTVRLSSELLLHHILDARPFQLMIHTVWHGDSESAVENNKILNPIDWPPQKGLIGDNDDVSDIHKVSFSEKLGLDDSLKELHPGT